MFTTKIDSITSTQTTVNKKLDKLRNQIQVSPSAAKSQMAGIDVSQGQTTTYLDSSNQPESPVVITQYRAHTIEDRDVCTTPKIGLEEARSSPGAVLSCERRGVSATNKQISSQIAKSPDNTYAKVASRNPPSEGKFTLGSRSKTPSKPSLRGVRCYPPTEVFVTRLEPDTTVDDLLGYIKQKSGIQAECEQLQTKFNTYASFWLSIPGQYARSVLRSNYWPTDVLVRKYYTRSQRETTRETDSYGTSNRMYDDSYRPRWRCDEEYDYAY